MNQNCLCDLTLYLIFFAVFKKIRYASKDKKRQLSIIWMFNLKITITIQLNSKISKLVNPIQDGHFRDYLRMGVVKRPNSLKSVRHILQWWKLAQLYLAWRRPKKYMNHVHSLWVLLASVFFIENQQILLYQKMQI